MFNRNKHANAPRQFSENIMNADTNTTLMESRPNRNGLAQRDLSHLPMERAGEASIHWSWACRKVDSLPRLCLEESPAAPPVPGDVALVRVERVSFHKRITTAENRRLRLYP